jgi:hypothetical protein
MKNTTSPSGLMRSEFAFVSRSTWATPRSLSHAISRAPAAYGLRRKQRTRHRQNFKDHFAAAHHQHTQMQGESIASSGYHAANSAVGRHEDQMAEATIGTLANLTTSRATDRGIVATLTEANSRLARQLEDHSNESKEIKALLKRKELTERVRELSTLLRHTIQSCNYPKHGHKHEANKADNMGGSQANRE